MKQYALYIQKYNKNNDKINNNNKNENKMKVKKRRRGLVWERERGKAWREKILFFFSFLNFFLRSMKIGSQVFVGAEGKVDIRNESYA